jgi:acyl-CoA thioesterase I
MRTYFFASCLLLAACGEQPKSEAPTAHVKVQPSPVQTDDRPAIVAFGDSLSAGFGVEGGLSYPDFLQKELDRRGLHYRVVNAGNSGDTSSDGLDRVEQVIAMKPAIVIVEFGANDGLRGLPVASTRANLEQIIERLQKAGARIVLAGMTLPPNYGPDYIRSFEKIYPELAKKYKAALIPFLLEGVAGDTRYMQRDGLHPNVEGNRRVAQNVMRTLGPLL